MCHFTFLLLFIGWGTAGNKMRTVYHAERKSATEHAGKLSREGKAARGNRWAGKSQWKSKNGG